MKDLDVIIYSRSSYGLKDLPKIFSVMIAQAVEMYRQHCPVALQAEDWLLQQVEFVLQRWAYCNDLFLLLSRKDVLFFLKKLNRPIQHLTHPYTSSKLARHEQWVINQSSDCLVILVSTMTEVLNICSLQVKRWEVMDSQLSETLADLPVMKKWRNESLNSVDKRIQPAAALVHQESSVNITSKKNRVSSEQHNSREDLILFDDPETTNPASAVQREYTCALGRRFLTEDLQIVKTNYLFLSPAMRQIKDEISKIKSYAAFETRVADRQ